MMHTPFLGVLILSLGSLVDANTCSSYNHRIVAATPGSTSAVWNDGAIYPTIYASPCTKISFGDVQSNHNVMKVNLNGYTNCVDSGSDTEEILPLTSSDFPYSIGNTVYTVGPNPGVEELYFICSKFTHCSAQNQKVKVVIIDHDEPWNVQLGSTEADSPNGAVWDDSSDTIVIVGGTLGMFSYEWDTEPSRSLGREDCTVAKIDAFSGNLVWKLQEGTMLSETCKKVAVDSAGDIWIIGETTNGMFSEDSAADGDSAYMSDVFLTRVTPSGSMPPSQHVLLDEAGVDFAIDIKVLSGGDLVFLTTHSLADHRSPGDRSGYGGDFLMRVYRVQPSYIISGAMQLSGGLCGTGCVWMKEYTTDEGRSSIDNDSDIGKGDSPYTRDITPKGLVVGTGSDGTEYVYVAGDCAGTDPAVGGGGDGSMDGFVLQLEASDGSTVQATRVASIETRDDFITDICLDVYGEIIVTGITKGSLKSSYTNKGGYDVFTRKLLKNNLSTVWTSMAGGVSDDFSGGCAVDSTDDSIYTVMNTEDTVDIRGTSASGTLANIGGHDIVVLRMNGLSGNLESALQWGTRDDDQVNLGWLGLFRMGEAMSDNMGNLYIFGTTRGGLGADHMGNSDGFLSKISRDLVTKAVYDSSSGYGVGGGAGGEGMELSAGTKTFLIILAIAVSTGLCACGYIWGVKKTETKYGRLRDGESSSSSGVTGGGGRAVAMESTKDDNYDL